MAIAPGTRFGSYEITGSIGAGGMGEVYRATDTNLKRDVAIKVLPQSFAADENRLARFQREAEVLASLNHPNIAQIFGLEQSDGTTALVMELVEGPTLADRIADGPLPADEALSIAMQIADALEAAHGQNIVHRDLKPANVNVRPDGTVKVLDFGIAKAIDPENLTTGSQSPMLTTPATQVGVILGTAAYMSPEQAKGKPIDERTDIWAFGCVLYEMLTGQLAFGAEDVPTTLARVIDRDTDMSSLPAAASPAVRHAIKLCLQKDVRERLADIRDVRLALKGALETVSLQTANEVAAARPLWLRVLPPVATAIVAASVAAVAVWVGTRAEPPAVNRFDYDLPEDQVFRNAQRPVIDLSPDGRQFVFNTTDGLYLRTMGELEARLIPGMEAEANSASPTFSPDGQSVLYGTGPANLKRIAISGGAPVSIAEGVTNAMGISWEADGTILFGQLGSGIHRVSANGGTPERIIPMEAGDSNYYGPELLPDGDSVLFSSIGGGDWDAAQIVVQSLSTGERTILVQGGTDARYLSTGHLVYARGDGLFAVRFDPDSLTVSGGAVPLVQGVMRVLGVSGPVGPAANYAVSANGTLVYVTGSLAATANTFLWVDREGREEAIPVPPRNYIYPRISPDGTKVALDVRDQELDIWTWDLARETLTRLTFDPGQDEFPVWSPDNQRIAFSSSRSGGNTDVNLFWKAANGTGAEDLLAGSGGQIFPGAFLPDATGILVHGDFAGADANDDIAILRMDAEGGTTPLLATAYDESNPSVSPDGRWLAYQSNESGSAEIYVRPFPDIEAGRWQVSTGGGVQPLWARNGQELFYRNGDAVMAVPIQTEPSFSARNPEVMFEGNYLLGPGGRTYDVSLDGERFLMIKQVESESETAQIIVVQNWFEELKRLAPPSP